MLAKSEIIQWIMINYVAQYMAANPDANEDACVKQAKRLALLVYEAQTDLTGS